MHECPHNPFQVSMILSALCCLGALLLAGCAASSGERPRGDDAAPPPGIQAWMDRLSVAHEYDPETGFIVARETVALPALLAAARPLPEAVAEGERTGLPVVVFATADRCAPCQQYKKDALNDAAVIERLSRGELLATHIEVDREPAAADEILGSRAIPMTYLVRSGAVVASMRGQRSAADLLAWLDEQGL